MGNIKYFIFFFMFFFILYLFIAYESSKKYTIVSILSNKAGFFSTFFHTLNHYIYCKKNHINFRINSKDWLFKSINGFSDYFEKSTDLNYYDDSKYELEYGHGNQIGNYTIQEYVNIIPEIYKYNDDTIKEIQKTKMRFNLIDGNYDSIFIRRGDKLGNESQFLEESKYIDLLLQKNPLCHTIFLQTDDYNCFLGLKKYIDSRNLKIQLYTICDPDSMGVIVRNHEKNVLNTTIKNKQYLDSIIDRLNETKSVEDMNSDEIYQHTITMLIGIDILIHSNICVLDYQSNVSRFIKLTHKNPKNVYDIMNPDTDIDYLKRVCPTNSF